MRATWPASPGSLGPTGTLAPSSESLAPTDMLLRMRPEFLCCRHRKEPTCVVGEHKQLLRRLLEFFRVTGEEGTDDA